MPHDDEKAMERAREDARDGKSPSTQAGEFVREEVRHVREGKHGARACGCPRPRAGNPHRRFGRRQSGTIARDKARGAAGRHGPVREA
jgi:hypothetical protein